MVALGPLAVIPTNVGRLSLIGSRAAQMCPQQLCIRMLAFLTCDDFARNAFGSKFRHTKFSYDLWEKNDSLDVAKMQNACRDLAGCGINNLVTAWLHF